MIVPWSQVSTDRGRVFCEVIRWQYTSFKWSQAQVYFFQWFIWNMLCLCHYGPALSRFWFQTDLGRENSATFLKIKAGKTFSYHGHALVTLYVQFLCSDWSKIDRWVHEENLSSILRVVHFDSQADSQAAWTCDVFNCLFRLDVQNKIQLLLRVFCYSWLVCLFGFWQELHGALPFVPIAPLLSFFLVNSNGQSTWWAVKATSFKSSLAHIHSRSYIQWNLY